MPLGHVVDIAAAEVVPVDVCPGVPVGRVGVAVVAAAAGGMAPGPASAGDGPAGVGVHGPFKGLVRPADVQGDAPGGIADVVGCIHEADRVGVGADAERVGVRVDRDGHGYAGPAGERSGGVGERDPGLSLVHLVVEGGRADVVDGVDEAGGRERAAGVAGRIQVGGRRNRNPGDKGGAGHVVGVEAGADLGVVRRAVVDVPVGVIQSQEIDGDLGGDAGTRVEQDAIDGQVGNDVVIQNGIPGK